MIDCGCIASEPTWLLAALAIFMLSLSAMVLAFARWVWREVS